MMSADRSGAGLIWSERERQQTVEGHGWRGDVGRMSELLDAARCYLDAFDLGVWHYGTDNAGQNLAPPQWPWPAEFWKPSEDRVRNLEKAGALIAAAIDSQLNTTRGEQ